VLKEIQPLWERGSREIVLTGIEIGSYGKDLGYTGGLGKLLCDIAEYTDCKRLRMGSLAPELIGKEFFDQADRAKHILAPHFHISLQSGSDRILGLMRRRYNRRMAVENVTRLASLTDRTMLTADLMVGFPTESDEDFGETFSIVEELSLLDAHVFAYSRRSGTPAADMKGQIPEDIKRARSAALIEEVERVRNMKLDRTVEEGRVLPAILENYSGGTYEGHTDSYIELRVDAPEGLSSRPVTVMPKRREGGVIIAELVSVEEA
jgi:threonylcarbamoyladenosine tRNA methylthiotransferase MtaB